MSTPASTCIVWHDIQVVVPPDSHTQCMVELIMEAATVFLLPPVVELFNAVSKQQKEIEEKLDEAGSSERKKTKGIVVCGNIWQLLC